ATSSPGAVAKLTPLSASRSPSRLTSPRASTEGKLPSVNSESMPFPATRLRRLRSTDTFRSLVRETELSPAHLIMPAFVVAGEGIREEIPSMPGVERYSISNLVEHAGEVAAAGIKSMLIFGIPADKDDVGSGAYDDEGIVQMAVRALKDAHPDLTI